MNLYQFADLHHLVLGLKRYPVGKERFSVWFHHVRVKTGKKDSMSFFGGGKSATAAMKDYARVIRGKTLIVEGVVTSQEIDVPPGLIF